MWIAGDQGEFQRACEALSPMVGSRLIYFRVFGISVELPVSVPWRPGWARPLLGLSQWRVARVQGSEEAPDENTECLWKKHSDQELQGKILQKALSARLASTDRRD